MSVYLTGVDIIEVNRIKDAINNSRGFLNKVFTGHEINYCESKGKQKFPSYASRFAAKESVAKALGKGFGKNFTFKEIEIKNSKTGAPFVNLLGKAKELADSLKIKEIKITISATENYAVAFSISIN